MLFHKRLEIHFYLRCFLTYKRSDLPKVIFTIRLATHAALVYAWKMTICLYCLSCWGLPNHGAVLHVFGIIGNQLMNNNAWCGFVIYLGLPCRSYWILNNFVKKTSTKLELIFERKLRQIQVVLLESPWVDFLEVTLYFVDIWCGRY